MPSNDDFWHSICLDSIAVVNTVRISIFRLFSFCLYNLSYWKKIYIYIPFLLYFHHPPLKLVDRIPGKFNMFTPDIPKTIYISSGQGPAEDFVAVNHTWVVFSLADNTGGKKPWEACLTEVKWTVSTMIHRQLFLPSFWIGKKTRCGIC